jgi:2'-5' RNA ligase
MSRPRGSEAAGDTALALLVPEADPVVERWRLRYDPSAARGVAAHITVLGPFLGEEEIARPDVDALRRIAARTPYLHLRFERTGHFPGVLWLDPTAATCLPLFQTVHQRWPECIPYGDPDLDVVPHLTVTRTAGPEAISLIETALAASLPLDAEVRAMTLLAFDGTRWRHRTDFPFGQMVRPRS